MLAAYINMINSFKELSVQRKEKEHDTAYVNFSNICLWKNGKLRVCCTLARNKMEICRFRKIDVFD